MPFETPGWQEHRGWAKVQAWAILPCNANDPMFDFFRNYNEQLEILFEGHDPSAHQLLRHADVDLMRNHLNRDEAICAYATGRAVGAGRTIWAVTTQSLLVVQTSKRQHVRKLDLSQIEQVEAEEGRYGFSLRALLPDARVGLYGVHRSFAVLALRALARPAVAEGTSTIAEIALTDAEQTHVLHAFADLALRAQPLLAHSAAEAQQLLQNAAVGVRIGGSQHTAEAV
jgi:hypothetical protein